MQAINTKTITLALAAIFVLSIAGFAHARGYNSEYNMHSGQQGYNMMHDKSQHGTFMERSGYGHRHGGGSGCGGYFR